MTAACPVPTASTTTVDGALLVDARALHASGIGRYLRELLGRWLSDPPFGALTLLGEPDALDAFVRDHRGPARVRIVPYGGGFYSARSQAAWLALRGRGATRADVAFFPHWDAPWTALPRGAVVTVHDLIHFQVPDAASGARRAFAGVVFERVVRRAARVITVSERTAHDLRCRVPATASRIRVVPNGVSAHFADAPVAESPVDGPYVLCVGNQKPHKNLGLAVAAFARLRADHPTLRLVVVGRRYGDAHAAGTAAAALGVADGVIELGEVSDDVLHALYARCAALLFPSRHEGFGLPILEAMSAGAPVVAADAPGVTETCGDAALLCGPHDADAMARAVARLLVEPAWRAELGRRGRAHAARFSWDATATSTAAVLREALAGAEAGR